MFWDPAYRVKRTQEGKYTELAHGLPFPGCPSGQSPLLGADRKALVTMVRGEAKAQRPAGVYWCSGVSLS